MKSLFVAFAIALGITSCETTDSAAPELVQTAAMTPEEESASVPSGVIPYPRANCLVTGEKLDAKNTPITFVHKNQEIKVCCAACEMAFKMSPKTYMAKIQ